MPPLEQTPIIGRVSAPVKRAARRRSMARSARLALTVLFAGPVGAAAQECALTVTEPFAPASVTAPKNAPRVRDIRFEGQVLVSAAALSRRMELKPARVWRSSRRSVYTEEAWAADHRRLCDLLRDQGLVAAAIGPPELVAL